MPEHSDIDALIQGLQNFQKEIRVEDLLEKALTEPLATEERLRQIEQALETFKQLGLFGRDDAQDLHLLLTLGRTYERLSHLDRAHETFQTALALSEQLGDTQNQAFLLCRIGRVLSRWDRWAEALDYLDRSARIYQELDDTHGLARVSVNRGIVFYGQGDYEAATAAYEDARAQALEVGDRQIVANVANNLAVLATIQGDAEDAITRYEECLTMYRDADDAQGMARTYHNLGMTHADRRDWGAAMNCYEKGFEVAQQGGRLDVMANIHLGMAEVLLELGNSSMVAMCCARALDIYRRIGNRLGEADAYRLLGRTFARRREWETAGGLFQDGLRLFEEYANPLGAAETHREIGKMNAARGLKTEARVAYDQALVGLRRLGARADVAEVETLLEELDAS